MTEIDALFCKCGDILRDNKIGQELWFWQHWRKRGCSNYPTRGKYQLTDSTKRNETNG